MLIRDMFAEDINRKIKGVIQVEQDETAAIEQEVREYVITKELKKHFMNFFNYYSHALRNPQMTLACGFPAFSEVVNLTF